MSPSFLDARLAAAPLRTTPTQQNLNDPEWRNRLHTGTTALLRDDLADVAGSHDTAPALLLAVLRATAFAQGHGLPWAEVWPAVAAAVMGSPAPDRKTIDTAIRLVHNSRLVGYLTAGEEDGRVVYRPVHQRVAEVLLRQPHTLTPATASAPASASASQAEQVRIHRAIATTCADLARAAAPLAPHPYVRRHTVAHAHAGRYLVDAVMPLQLAARETSGTLRARMGLPLPLHDPTLYVVTAAGLIEPYLDATVDYRSRVASIRFHLDAAGQADTDAIEPLPHLPLKPQRTTWRPLANVVASPPGSIHDMCTMTTPDGRSLIAAATRYGIGVWDSTTAQQLLHIPTTYIVHTLAVARGSSGRPFLVTGGTRGAAVYDPLSGRLLASLKTRGPGGAVHVLADGPERWKVAVQAHGSMAVWHPSEDVFREVEMPPGLVPLSPKVWATDADGRRYCLCHARGDDLTLFNPLTKRTIPTGLSPSAGRNLAAVTGPAGHDVLAVPRRRHVDLLSPFGGAQLDPLPVQAQRAVALEEAGDRTVLGLITDESVDVWRLSESAPQQTDRYYPPQPHGKLRGVTSGRGRTWKLASSGHEGILLWDRRPHRATPHKQSKATASASHRLMSVTRTTAGDELLALASQNTVALIDPDTGYISAGHSSRFPIRALEAFPAHNDDTVIALEHAQGIELWNATRDQIRPVTKAYRPKAWCALRTPEGDPALALCDPYGVTITRLTADGQSETIFAESSRAATACLVLPAPETASTLVWAVSSGLHIADLRTGRIIAQTDDHSLRRTGARADHRAPRTVNSLTLLPLAEGDHVVAAATAHDITLIDTKTWEPRIRIETPSTATMTTLPDDNGSVLLVTANNSGVRIWDPRTGDLIHTLLTAAPVTNLAHTSKGGHRLHLSGSAGTATLSWTPQDQTS
ncbi:hypothetical protein ACWGI1_01690 [Streptomyces sp. NPDC054835]